MVVGFLLFILEFKENVMDIKEELRIAIDTLNAVAVDGYKNRQFMLGAENTLRRMLHELQREGEADGKAPEAE